MLAVFVWFLLLYASVCIYLLRFKYWYTFAIFMQSVRYFDLWTLCSQAFTRFPVWNTICFVRVYHLCTLYVFSIITSCNYLFIISTCHVISSVIFWRHSQQVAYHVIYKVLVTWHMIFQKKYFMCTILISFLWIKCFKDIYFSRVFILTKIVNDLKDFVHKNISSVVCCLMSNKKTWRVVWSLTLISRRKKATTTEHYPLKKRACFILTGSIDLDTGVLICLIKVEWDTCRY